MVHRIKPQVQKNIALSSLAVIGVAAIAIVLHLVLEYLHVPDWLAHMGGFTLFFLLAIPIPYQFFTTIRMIKHAAIDDLTGLMNRSSFIVRLQQTIDHCIKTNEKFHLLILDLNKFKQVNDTLGHDIGDKLLQEFALKLNHSIRDCDSVSRLGGDEFAIILMNDQKTSKSYEPFAIKIAKLINAPIKIEEHYLYIGVSIGIASYPESGASVNDLMRCADIAMYSAKKMQKDYTVFREEDDTFNIADLSLLGELRSGIDHEEFELWYQPKKNAKTNTIDSLECLIRWQHPTRGLLAPFHFIPAAEASGMIKFLTQIVIREAANTYRTLVAHGFDLDISINVSPNDIVDSTMMTTIIKSIVKADMAPEKLVLEVTETAIMHDPDAAFKVLAALQSLGVKISIDDFGTGHSSMTYLKNFPIGEVKLDRSFITDIEHSSQGYNIVKSTIELSHNLKATTVGEGVETKEIEDMLRELNIDHIQGFYVARPMPLTALIEWLQDFKDANHE